MWLKSDDSAVVPVFETLSYCLSSWLCVCEFVSLLFVCLRACFVVPVVFCCFLNCRSCLSSWFCVCELSLLFVCLRACAVVCVFERVSSIVCRRGAVCASYRCCLCV